jgi:TolB-like protein
MNRTGRKTVAVVDFTDLQGNVTELGRFLAEQLSVSLGSRGGTFETIDRNHLRALLQEHKLSATGLIDPLTARKVGEIAGAECLVSGSITPFSESVNLSIKLLDTSTAKILGGTTIDIPRTSTINELLAKGISTPAVGEGAGQGATGLAAPQKAPSALPGGGPMPPAVQVREADDFVLSSRAAHSSARRLLAG